MPASNTYLILKALNSRDLTTREISSITNLTPKAVSKICCRLESDGLIEHPGEAWHKAGSRVHK